MRFKPVKECSDYLVCCDGRVLSLKKEGNPRVMSPFVTKAGYSVMNICLHGKQVFKRVHRLVAEAFISNPENKPEVNHINGIKTDNRVSNLEWCTPKENVRHAIKMNLREKCCVFNPKGSLNGSSKLFEKDIVDIRLRIKKGELLKDLALEFKVSPAAISDIKRRVTWKHI